MGHSHRRVRQPPHLPFLNGLPTFAPNLSPIEEIDWLLPDTEAADWLGEKRELMVRRRSDVLAIQRGSGPACCEASRMVFDHLGEKNQFIFQTQLEDAAAQVSDDLCIMQMNDDAEWCLTAASLCAPTFWRLRDNIGKPLGGLHGAVPGGDPDLSSRISRIFTALQPSRILERCNWTVQSGGERFTPSSAPLKAEVKGIEIANAIDEIYLRVERQTIRKLPETGAVLFTIRICVDPMRAVFEVPGTKEAFAEVWRSADDNVRQYKGWPVYEPLIARILS